MTKLIRGVRQSDGTIAYHINSGDCVTLLIGDNAEPDVSKVNVLIDCHSHIQSGATVPLPLLWEEGTKKTGAKVHFERSVTDAIGPVIFGKAGKIQRLKTEKIAGLLVDETTAAYKDSRLLEDDPYKRYQNTIGTDKKKEDTPIGLFAPVITMTMDMDFAHIAGFPPESSRIYHEGRIPSVAGKDAPSVTNYGNPSLLQPPATNSDGVYCYERNDGTALESKGKFIDVSHEKPNHVWAHQQYKNQIDSTIEAVKKNPWQLIPMFHYDPRRWCQSTGENFDEKTWSSGPWDEPFKFIATQKNAGIFIGFKMYPPLGYKPLDKRLPNLEKFYARCEDKGIPVLAHCSPGGMCTHEAKYYYQLDKADLSKQPDRLVSVSYDPCTPLGYFYDNYVHPQNWRPVLMKYPKLKLCLAHFGGVEWDDEIGSGLASDWVEEVNNMCNPEIEQGQGTGGPVKFENVYTDIACQDIENSSVRENTYRLFSKMGTDSHYKHLQNKLLFGVDWYLSLLTGAPEYKAFSEQFFDIMKACDPWQWYRSSLVNVVTFYGLDNTNILKNMNDALNKRITNNKDISKCVKNFEQIKKIKEQVENLRKDMKYAQTKGSE